MKRIVCAFLVSVLMINLTACSENEFRNLVSFTEKFNKAEDKLQISYEDFIIDSDNTYNLFFPEDNSSVLLRLTENEEGRIEQIRILIGKYDALGKEKQISEEDRQLFLSVIKLSVMAYTSYSSEQTVLLMNDFSLYDTLSIKKQGELNKTQDCFHFVYYSNSLASMFTVTNTWLCEVPETEKPESKPYFGSTTNVDGESIKLN